MFQKSEDKTDRQHSRQSQQVEPTKCVYMPIDIDITIANTTYYAAQNTTVNRKMLTD
jgi:hypothetical protein